MSLIYTTIQHGFRKQHGLTLNEYVLCDMVHILSTKRDSKVPGWCWMTKVNMGKELGLSKQSIITLTKKMEEAGFIEKQEVTGFLRSTKKWESVYFTDGQESLPRSRKFTTDGQESLPEDGQESLPYNNNLDNNTDNKKPTSRKKEDPLKNKDAEKKEKKQAPKKEKKQADLFGEKPNPNKKTLFRNSLYFELQVFKSNLPGLEEAGVDLEYYHRAIDNWSEMKTVKRTSRGWIATARTWMEKDKQNGKLKLLKTEKEMDQMDQEMKEYLNI